MIAAHAGPLLAASAYSGSRLVKRSARRQPVHAAEASLRGVGMSPPNKAPCAALTGLRRANLPARRLLVRAGGHRSAPKSPLDRI